MIGYLFLTVDYAKGFNGTIGKIPPEYDSVEFFGNNTDGNYLAEKIYSIYMWIHISTTNSLGKKPYHPERSMLITAWGSSQR